MLSIRRPAMSCSLKWAALRPGSTRRPTRCPGSPCRGSAADGAPLAALRAAELEREDDLGDPAEQGEEPDPDQQQHGPGGKPLLGDPETEQDLHDAREHAEPPHGVAVPR